MITIDLVTGFLGAGKTTFIKKYAAYLAESGARVGILENDYGAVNVDVMLLEELEKIGCGLETVAGACDRDCHVRRFKTKLIALAMSGYDRVIVEPSGIFDTDEFFDSLHEEPLDRWYNTGSVITIADAGADEKFSEKFEYIFGSECAAAGTIILSRTQDVSEDMARKTVKHIEQSVQSIGCRRNVTDCIIRKNWDDLTQQDMQKISQSGYFPADFIKKYHDISGCSSLYFMNSGLSAMQICDISKKIFSDDSCGNVFRIKGFIPENSEWYELNDTKSSHSLKPIGKGQEIIIVIGENLNKAEINRCFGEV